MSERYIVRELEGWAVSQTTGVIGSSQPPGLSVHVLDTAWNYRVVYTDRTEDQRNGMTRASTRERISEQAQTHCAMLNRVNAAHLREVVSPDTGTAA